MSRNYQMYGLFQDEARRADNRDEYLEFRELMDRKERTAELPPVSAGVLSMSAAELQILEQRDLD